MAGEGTPGRGNSKDKGLDASTPGTMGDPGRAVGREGSEGGRGELRVQQEP